MTWKIAAGPARRVVVVNDEKVEGGVALPVYGWIDAPSDGRPVSGGPAVRVKVITDVDLIQNGGKYQLSGAATALPLSGSSVVLGSIEGNVALAVYAVNPSDWPVGSSPPVPTSADFFDVDYFGADFFDDEYFS